MARTALLFDNVEEFKRIIQDSIKTTITELLPSLINEEKREPDYLSIIEAAQLLHLSKQTIYQNIKSIKHYKINGKLLFKKADLINYVETNGYSKNK